MRKQQQFCFYFHEKKLEAFKVVGKSFEPLLYKGDEFCSSPDFSAYWEWWKDAVAYTDSESYDFCFFSLEKDIDFQVPIILNHENKFSEIMISLFYEYLGLTNENVFIHGEKAKSLFSITPSQKGFTEQRFDLKIPLYVTFFPENRKILAKMEAEHIPNDNEKSILYKHFNAKTKQYEEMRKEKQ